MNGDPLNNALAGAGGISLEERKEGASANANTPQLDERRIILAKEEVQAMFKRKYGQEDTGGLIMGGFVLVGLAIGMWTAAIAEWVVLSIGLGLIVKAVIIARNK